MTRIALIFADLIRQHPPDLRSIFIRLHRYKSIRIG